MIASSEQREYKNNSCTAACSGLNDPILIIAQCLSSVSNVLNAECLKIPITITHKYNFVLHVTGFPCALLRGGQAPPGHSCRTSVTDHGGCGSTQ